MELAPTAPAAATRAAELPDTPTQRLPTTRVVPLPATVARHAEPPTGYPPIPAQQPQFPRTAQRAFANSTKARPEAHGQPPTQSPSVAAKPRRKWPWIVGGIVLLLFIIGISGGNEKNSTPTVTTTTSQAQAPAAPAQVTVPGDLVGKNAQLADDELRKLGIIDIFYVSQDASSKVAPLLENWIVTKVAPAPGTAVLTTDTVVVTATKKPSPVAAVVPPAGSVPAPEPAAPILPPADSSPSGSTGGFAYYRNCAAARAAGVAPLHRGEPGYRSGLDRDGDGVACE